MLIENKLDKYTFALLQPPYFLISYFVGKNDIEEWAIGYVLYFYFSYLIWCFFRKKVMNIAYGVVEVEKIYTRVIMLVMSIVAAIIFSFWNP